MTTPASPPPAPDAPPLPTLTADQRDRLLALLRRLVPLAEGLLVTLRNGMLLGALALVWLGVWMLWRMDWAAAVSLPLLALAALPLLVLVWFWSALVALVELPETVSRLWTEAGGEVSTLTGLHAGPAPKPGLGRAAGSLWRLGGLVQETRELLGGSLAIGGLFNPLALIIGVLALLWLLALLVIAGVLALVAVL